MDSQDLHNLQEAYSNLYEQKIGVPLKDASDRAAKDQLKRMIPKGEKVYTPKATLQNAAYEPDTFDAILEYLVAEGYADTNDNALVIMANMSEEWRQTILEYGGGGGAAPNIPNAAVKAVDKLGSMFNKVAPKKPVKKQTPDGFNPHQKFN